MDEAVVPRNQEEREIAAVMAPAHALAREMESTLPSSAVSVGLINVGVLVGIHGGASVETAATYLRDLAVTIEQNREGASHA